VTTPSFSPLLRFFLRPLPPSPPRLKPCYRPLLTPSDKLAWHQSWFARERPCFRSFSSLYCCQHWQMHRQRPPPRLWPAPLDNTTTAPSAQRAPPPARPALAPAPHAQHVRQTISYSVRGATLRALLAPLSLGLSARRAPRPVPVALAPAPRAQRALRESIYTIRRATLLVLLAPLFPALSARHAVRPARPAWAPVPSAQLVWQAIISTRRRASPIAPQARLRTLVPAPARYVPSSARRARARPPARVAWLAICTTARAPRVAPLARLPRPTVPVRPARVCAPNALAPTSASSVRTASCMTALV